MISGQLTPTPQKSKDMRLDSSLNTTLGGSLVDLPNAECTERTGERETLVSEEGPQRTLEITGEGISDTRVKTKPASTVRETPRRIQRAREASREEAIESTQQFFATVDERNRGNITGVIFGNV